MGLSLILYNVLVTLGLILGSPFLLLLFAMVPKTRAGFQQKVGRWDRSLIEKLSRRHPEGAKRVWFHAVSVGEFNAIRPLVLTLIDEGVDVVVSTTTLTGQTLARRVCAEAATVLYFPYDLRWLVKQVLTWVKPDVIAIAETELWPNFFDVATRKFNIPLLIINGRISPSSFKGYQKLKPLMSSVLSRPSHFYMQSALDQDRIIALGAPPERVSVAGNVKFDILPTTDQAFIDQLRQVYGFSKQDAVLVFASTHGGEDPVFVTAYMGMKRDFPDLKMILAPRHPERTPAVKQVLNTYGLRFSQRSMLSPVHPNGEDIVLVDTIGELKHLFALGSVAVIGGSFVPHGGHNPIEPLCQGIPVIFGPHMFNFPEITRLILEAKAGVEVPDSQGLQMELTRCLTHPEQFQRMVVQGHKLLEKHRGATQILLKALQGVLANGNPQ